jgi:hypothetical protein
MHANQKGNESMKNIKPWLCGAALALGCKSPAERVISQYASEEDCMDRLQYTIQPEADRAAFEREYPSGLCKTGSPKVDARACSKIKVGETCFVTVETDKRVCVQRASDAEFKVDWQCSTGYNEIPLKTYRAGSQDVVVLRLRVELSDYYNYHYSGRKGTHQSLRMSDRRNETLHGYVARSSETAQRLESLLADGNKHDLMLAVANPYSQESSEHVEVLGLVQEDWRTLPPATLEAAKKRAGDHLWELKEAARIAARERLTRELNASLR